MTTHQQAAGAAPAPTLAEVVAFLDGSGPLMGCHFGDRPLGERGSFWWRKYLRAALANQGTDSGAAPAESQHVLIDFEQIGTAGPFLVADGRVAIPTITMLDLVRMLKPTYDAPAAPDTVPAASPSDYDTLKLFNDLQDLCAEANAVDTVIGRPAVLQQKLIKMRDTVGQMTQTYLPHPADRAARQPIAPAPLTDAKSCWACDGTGVVTTSSNGSGLMDAACDGCTPGIGQKRSTS